MNATAVSARLTRLEPTLPSHYYFDREHYERELALFWYRDWHIVGRVDGLSDPGDYRLIKLVGWIFSPPRKFLESCRGLVE